MCLCVRQRQIAWVPPTLANMLCLRSLYLCVCPCLPAELIVVEAQLLTEFQDGHTQATQQEARTWKQIWQECRTRATSCQLVPLLLGLELLLWRKNRNSGFRQPPLDIKIVLKSSVFTTDGSISHSVTDLWQLMQTNRPADKQTWPVCQAVGDDRFIWSHSLTLVWVH